MRKMKLDLDQLDVESFSTAPDAGGRATVRAHAPTADCTEQTCYDETGAYYNTCEYLTCDGVCTTARCTAGESVPCAGCTSVIGCASADGQCPTGSAC